MRLYIAAPWKDRDSMESIAKSFETSGHEITWKWWSTPDIPESDRGQHSELTRQAHNDFNGVVQSDLVVLINSAKSEGKSFEQGVAISHSKPIIAVGRLGEHSTNVFHYLPGYRWVDKVEDAVFAVNLLQWAVDNASKER